ncbi:hypothetical protein HY634_00710 [Candidatus Uhrbacteria bacterium]|nr:hypothetical protein [Candidatus Uhrbacteria bacterium]
MPVRMRHQEQAKRVGLVMLGVIATGGIITAAAVMPGIVAIGALLPRKPVWRQRDFANRALKRLIRRGFVEEAPRGRVIGYQLTDRGREYLARCEFAGMKSPMRKRWDGKWRLVVFDVPEKRRHLRDHLRTYLKRLGFYPLQQSAWLFPYPCEDVVRLMKVDLGLGHMVQCVTYRGFEDRDEEASWRLRFDV